MVHIETALEEPPFTMGKMHVHSGALVAGTVGSVGDVWPGTQEGGGQPKFWPLLYSQPASHSLTWRKTQKRVLCQWAGVKRALFASGFGLAGGQVGGRTRKPS